MANIKPFLFLPLFAILTGCVASSSGLSSRVERLRQEVSQFQRDPDIIAWLADEAADAGVRSISAVPSGGIPMNGRRMFIQYGLTTSDRKIYVNAASAGGRSVVNLTHEIAHAARLGGACGGHNSRWLNKYLEIAASFEARFPGAKWSGTTPTLRVMRNKDRYNIGNGC